MFRTFNFILFSERISIMHAITIRIIFVALLASIGSSQPIIKQAWTRVNAQGGDSTSTNLIHAAAFSDGRYIIVYPVVQENNKSGVRGQIFYPNSSVAVPEFDLDPDQNSIFPMTVPNVAVFNDDTFVITYRWESTVTPQIRARRFGPDGTPLDSSYSINGGTKVVAMQGDLSVIGFADKSFVVFYYSSSASCLAGVLRTNTDSLVYDDCLSAVPVTAASVVHASKSNLTEAYYAINTASDSKVSFGWLVNGELFDQMNTASISGSPLTETALTLMEDRVILLYTSENSICGLKFDIETVVYSIQCIVNTTDTKSHSSPAVLRLSDKQFLLAYRSTDTTDNSQYLTCKRGNLFRFWTLADSFADQTVNISQFNLELNQNKLTVATNLSAVNMVPIHHSDILVVAKDPVTGNVMRQVITFCGNGQLELDEECEGGNACDSYCMCTNGLIGYNGVCGLPNVIPVLDCVQPVQQGNTLYFSFINQDRVVHTINQGETNAFSPSEYGGNRPTTFTLGSTLTYPVSPYSVVIPTSEKRVSWLLGSYNLTVDLTDVTPLLCPDSLGLVTAVQGNLTNSSLLAQNFADRYGVSLSRLNTTVTVYTDGNDVTIIVSPADNSSSSEPNPVQAVRSAVEDFKNSTTRTDVTSDLLNGNDGTTIKDITPTPTGVEVRGTRYDSSNVTPQPQSQSPQSMGPSGNSNEPVGNNSVSSAVKLLFGYCQIWLLIEFLF